MQIIFCRQHFKCDTTLPYKTGINYTIKIFDIFSFVAFVAFVALLWPKTECIIELNMQINQINGSICCQLILVVVVATVVAVLFGKIKIYCQFMIRKLFMINLLKKYFYSNKQRLPIKSIILHRCLELRKI